MNVERRVLWWLHDIGQWLMKWAERRLFEGARIKFKS